MGYRRHGAVGAIAAERFGATAVQPVVYAASRVANIHDWDAFVISGVSLCARIDVDTRRGKVFIVLARLLFRTIGGS